MSLKITHKYSTAAGTPPASGDIDVGEIAINAADAELYTKDNAGNVRKFQNTTTGTADGLQFTQAGTGAVQRTVESKLQDVVSVLDFSTLAEAFTYCIDNSKKLNVPSGQTVVVPTDCPTLQDAFNIARSNGTITVQIATGTTLSDGLVLENGDWSNFTITSVDAQVLIGSGFAAEEDIIYSVNASCPRIATVFNGQSLYGRNGFYLQGSSIYINESCGVVNIGGTGTGTNTSGVIGGGLVLIRSTAYCRNSTFTGNDDINLFCTQGSQVYGDFGTFTGAKGDANVYIGRGSTGSVSYSNMSDATTGTGLRVRRSICVALSCTATGNAGYGILAEEGAYVVANDQSTTPSDFSNNTIAALKVVETSMLDAAGCTATGTAKGLIAETGSTVNLSNCNITSSNTTLDITDSTVVLNSSALSSSTRGALCSRGKMIGTGTSITTSANEAIYALQGSTLSLPSLTLSGGARGLRLVGSVKADCPSCSITGWSTAGVDISNLSTVNLYQGTVAEGVLTSCISLTRGCTVVATSCTTSNSAGTPALGDTNVASFNAISTNLGVIYV